MTTRNLSKNLDALIKDLKTRSSHTDNADIEDRSLTAQNATEENKSSDELEKKRLLLSTGRNRPPELVPYCDEIPVSDQNKDNSSPPRLFPEGIMTRNKLNKSLPGKTVKDIQVVDTGTAPPQNQDEVECIELDDSSEFQGDEKCIIVAGLKRKITPLSLGLRSLKRGKWRNTINEHKINNKSFVSFSVNMKMGKTRLRERDKLRKASERMRRSPRSLIPKTENCNADAWSVYERECGDDGNVNTSGTKKSKVKKDDEMTKYSTPSNLFGREQTGSFSQKKSHRVCEAVCHVPLTKNGEYSGMNSTECVDVSGETIGVVQPKNVQAESHIQGMCVSDEVATPLESTVKEQFAGTKKGYISHNDSFFSVCSKNGSTELLHTSLGCEGKHMETGTEQVAEDICNLSKIAVKDSLASVLNKYSKEQGDIDVCITSDSNSYSCNNKHLRRTEDKINVKQEVFRSPEQTEFTDLCQKQMLVEHYVESGRNGKEYGATETGEEPTADSSNNVDERVSCYYTGKLKACGTKLYHTDEVSHISDGELKKGETVMQMQSAELAKGVAVSEGSSNIIEHCCRKPEGNCFKFDVKVHDTPQIKNTEQSTKVMEDFTLHEGHKKVDCQKYCLGSAEVKLKEYEGIKGESVKTSDPNLKIYRDTINNKKKDVSGVMVAGSSSDGVFQDILGESVLNGTSKFNGSHISEKGVNCQSNVSNVRLIAGNFGSDLLAGCDDAQELHDDSDPNAYVIQGPNSWPVIDGDEDDDYIFTLPKCVSTGKEERDIIDGIEMLSFETEHDMVEFTKIQQDFYHGLFVDDGMIQSDDGLDMMDDAFPHSGDVDLQCVNQAIVPTKTNDITKIKGWRNKQFAVNDNPSHCDFSNEACEEDDGFESCDVKTADDANMEEDQQNHWYSEDTKHNDTDVGPAIKDEENEAADGRTTSGSSGKQKLNLVKDEVLLCSGDTFHSTTEFLKHLQTSVCETKNTKSAFVSDILDNYLSSHSQLNISYEIPKLGAEEGITHHSEHETDQFIFPSPPRPSHTFPDKLSLPRKTGPKPKTLAEKRKMLELKMREVESVEEQKRLPRRGRPRLRPRSEPVTQYSVPVRSIKCTECFDTEKPVALKLTDREDLVKEDYILDPDYKYTWIGKRPIRITGSKVNRELSVSERASSSDIVQSEIKQDPSHDSIVCDVTQTEHKVISDTKSSHEETEQNNNMNKVTPSKDLQPLESSDSPIPEYGMVVFPGVGHPLHPLAIKQLMAVRSAELYIDSKWAEFAVAVVTSCKDISDCDRTEKHVIPIKHLPLLEDVYLKTRSVKNDEVPLLNPENTLLNTEVPKDSDSGFSSFKIVQISPNSELLVLNPSLSRADNLVAPIKTDMEAACFDLKNSNADGNSSSPCVPLDEVQLEVKSIVRDMIECILNHEIEDTIIQDDPDVSSTLAVIPPKCLKKSVTKCVKNKVYRELNRLDVNVIVMADDRNGCVENVNGGAFCEQDFCQLGCVCASLQTCQSSATLSDHCGNSECMFECSCQESSTDQSHNNSTAEKSSLLYCTAMRLQDEGNRHLAKVEKEFRQTVIQSKNEVFVVGSGSSGDGGRRRREIKLPERYRDSSVVLGKEFAMAECKMIAGDEINITPAQSSVHTTRRSERQQLYLPDYVQLGVPKSASMGVTKPLHRSMRGKLTLEQKIPLWCERFKVKPCRIYIERTEGLEGVVPWCMIHSKYDCFCLRQSLKLLKRMSYRPLKRPPPIPGPPLDVAGANDKRKRSCSSRNVAVKSVSRSSADIHSHNVDRHSARTNGATINYVLRNQSHFFKRQRRKVFVQESEIMYNDSSSHYTPFVITQPVNGICKLEMTPSDFMVQGTPFCLNEEDVRPVNSDDGNDNEEIGFGKIVSIMSLKPEEFEKCGSVDQSQHEDDEACNMNMFLSPGELTEVPSAGLNIPEEDTHLTQIQVKTLNLCKDQECHSEEKFHESDIFEELSSALIPILPECNSDINSMRLAELISKKDSELKSILENCNMPLNLSQNTAGSVQLINWNILLNLIENETYHLWLQHKFGSAPKLIITGSADKPDEQCVSLRDYYPYCSPDIHSELPPLITFLIEQLRHGNRVRDVKSVNINCFGLVQFDGDNWELVCSLQRNVQVRECCSSESLQIQPAEQAACSETDERQEQDIKPVKPQTERSGDGAEKHCCILDGQDIRKEGKCHEGNGSNTILTSIVTSFSPPFENLRKHQSDVNTSQESMDKSLQLNEEPALKEGGQEEENHPHPDLPLSGDGGGTILCETTGMLIHPNKPSGLQFMQSDNVETTGSSADLTFTEGVCSESMVVVPDSELILNDLGANGKTVNNNAEQKFGTTEVSPSSKEICTVPDYPILGQYLSLKSELFCESCDLKGADSQGHTQRDDSLKDDAEKIMEVSPVKNSVVLQRTEGSADLESTLEHTVTSPTDTESVKLTANNCNSGTIIQTSGVEVPLPTGPDPARWYMLNVKSRFDLLHLVHSKCIIRYAQLIRAIYLANCHGKTVRVPLEKRLSKEVGGKNACMSHDEKQSAGAAQPKFGVYTVPNLYTRVFIGPYGLREDAGVSAIKIINGKLVNTMYFDSQIDCLDDADESITSLLESGGKEAILNTKMEQLYDSIALAPQDGRVCRGMWLYTTRSRGKGNTVGNVKSCVVRPDVSGVSSNSICTSSPPPVRGMDDEESNRAMDTNKSQSDLEGEELHTKIEDSKSYSENGTTAQHSLTDGSGIESRKVRSRRRKQALRLRNDASVTGKHNIAICGTARDVCFVEKGNKEQESSKGIAQLTIIDSNLHRLGVLPSMKSDSDEEVLDVETPCDAGSLFRKTHLLLKKKRAACNRNGRNKNVYLEIHKKQTVPGPEGVTASSSSVCTEAHHPSADPSVKDKFKIPAHAGPTHPQASSVVSVGKTVVSIKLVPSIPTVGYIKAVMYHNKSVMLKDPFSSQDEQAYFQNLETATRWLTDELKKRIECIPKTLTLLWRVKHATVDTKVCQLFDKKILAGNHVLTKNGVLERKTYSVDHAITEKLRRSELFACYKQLGSTFLSEQILYRTNRHNILTLAVKEIENIHLTNKRLLLELEMLRKRRITNCARFYQSLKALPSLEDRKRELDNLKAVFEGFGDTIPIIINLDETTNDADAENVTEQSRKVEDSIQQAENSLLLHKFDRASSNESDQDDYVIEEKSMEDNSRKTEVSDNEKPQTAYPLEMKDNVVDDNVSVSISVVRGDEPVPVVSQPEDKDVVTVTRIPQRRSEGKPLQDLINSNYKSCVKNAEGIIQSKLVASGRKKKSDKITTVLDTLKVIPLKVNADTCERKDEHKVKMDSVICFPFSPKIEVDSVTPENSSTVSILKESSDPSAGLFRVSSKQENTKSGRTKRKAGFENIILNKPQRSLLECLDAKGTVQSSTKKQGDSGDTDVRGPVPDLGGVCYTMMPSQRKRISICVDNKRIRACTSLGVRPVASIQDTNSVLQNFERFKLKQQSGGLISTGNLILADNGNKPEGGCPRTIRFCEVSRNGQNNCVKLTRVPEKDIAMKNSFSDLSALMNISKGPSITEKNSVSFSSLKKNFINRSSDLKYVVYDSANARLVPASVPSGNKKGYNIVTSSEVIRSANTQSCSNTALKTAVSHKETVTPVYVAIVSSANAHAAGTTTSVSASTVKNIMAAVGSSSQQAKNFGSQIASSLTTPPGPAVRLLQPVTARTVCVAGKKLVSVQRSRNKYMICNRNQLYAAHSGSALVVPAQKSISSVATNLTNSNSSTNEDSIPVLTVSNQKTGLYEDSPPMSEASAGKTPQPLECSTNSVNQTIKIKRLLPRVCDTFISDKVRRLSCDGTSHTDVATTSNFPKLTLTTHTNSIASHTLKPDVVSATQTKPVVSIRNSYAMNIVPTRLESSSSSVTVIPVAKEVSSASLENLKKSSTVCFRTVASSIPISKLVTSDTKSVESKTFNLKLTSPVSARKLFMLDVTKPSSGIPCSSDSVSVGKGELENVSDEQPVVSGNSEESEVSQNDSIAAVRISDKKSENDISSLKTSCEESQNDSTAHDTSSAEKKSQNDISTIVSLNDKSQNDISNVRESSEKIQNNKIFGVRLSDKKIDSPSTSSQKSKYKAQEGTGNAVKNTVRARAKRHTARARVKMMVTRSSGRRR